METISLCLPGMVKSMNGLLAKKKFNILCQLPLSHQRMRARSLKYDSLEGAILLGMTFL